MALSYPVRHAHAPHYVITCGLVLPCFSTLSPKRYNFRKKELLNIKCTFWFSLQILSETFLILRRTGRSTIKICIGPHVEWTFFRFYRNLNFLDRFSKNTQTSNFTKMCKWESRHKDGRTDGQTDMTKLTVAFRTPANTSNDYTSCENCKWE